MIIWKLPRKVSKIIAAVQQVGQSHARVRIRFEKSVRLIIQNTAVIQIATWGTERGIQTATGSWKHVVVRVTIATIVI